MDGRIFYILSFQRMLSYLFPQSAIVVYDTTGNRNGNQPNKEQAYPQELPDATGMIYPPKAV